MVTGLQLINEIEDRLGWAQSSTIEGNIGKNTRKIVRLLNRVLKTMGIVEQWPMLREDGTLITEAAVTTDDDGDALQLLLDLTNGSEVVTISQYETVSFSFLLKHKGWAITIGTGMPIYRVEKVVSPTQIELNRVWLGDTQTITTADSTSNDYIDRLTVVMAMDQYVLPEDFDRPTGTWQDMLSEYGVSASSPNQFASVRRSQGSSIRIENPTLYTVYGLDANQSRQVLHLNPWPEQQTMMAYSYQKEHPKIEQDVDRVLFPTTQLGMLIESVVYFADRDYEDDTRMQAALSEYMQQFKAIKGQNMATQEQKQMTPWRGNRMRSVRLARGSGVNIDYGDFFDRVENVELP